MRNVLLNLMVILSVFSVQGCWARETKSEISTDGKSTESDPIDAPVGQKNHIPPGKYVVGKTEFIGPRGFAVPPAEDMTICQEFAKNLNKVKETMRNRSMSCGVPIHADSKDFSLPDWSSIPDEQLEKVSSELERYAFEGPSRLNMEGMARHLNITVEEYFRRRVEKNNCC